MTENVTDEITHEKPGGVPRETWVSLAESAFASFKDRRELEWKLAFGFWAAIAVFTSACIAVPQPKVPKHLPTMLGGVYLLLFLTATFCFLLPVQRAHFDDKAWWKYYLRMAQWNGKKSLPSEPINGENMRPAKNGIGELTRIWSWYCGQVIFTAVFLTLSWATIATIHSTKEATEDTPRQALRIIEDLLKQVRAVKEEEVVTGGKNSDDSSIHNLSLPNPVPRAGRDSSEVPNEGNAPSHTDRAKSDVHLQSEK